MHRIALGCAALSVLLFAPEAAGAQQTTPDQDQPAPTASVPPPLPPMPSSHHRWIGAASEHRAATTHRRQAATRRPSAQERHAAHDGHATKDRHSARDRHAAHDRRSAHDRHSSREQHETVHASKKTVRKCHSMTYQQIMRSSSCRALMRQDIEGAEKPRHQAKHDRKSSKHDRNASRHDRKTRDRDAKHDTAKHRRTTTHRHGR